MVARSAFSPLDELGMARRDLLQGFDVVADLVRGPNQRPRPSARPATPLGPSRRSDVALMHQIFRHEDGALGGSHLGVVRDQHVLDAVGQRNSSGLFACKRLRALTTTEIKWGRDPHVGIARVEGSWEVGGLWQGG